MYVWDGVESLTIHFDREEELKEVMSIVNEFRNNHPNFHFMILPRDIQIGLLIYPSDWNEAEKLVNELKEKEAHC